MMQFRIFFRVENDQRAPATVMLESAEYESVGELEAFGLKQLIVKLREAMDEESTLEVTRPLRVGDVVVDELESAWILTPSLVWAMVEMR